MQSSKETGTLKENSNEEKKREENTSKEKIIDFKYSDANHKNEEKIESRKIFRVKQPSEINKSVFELASTSNGVNYKRKSEICSITKAKNCRLSEKKGTKIIKNETEEEDEQKLDGIIADEVRETNVIAISVFTTETYIKPKYTDQPSVSGLNYTSNNSPTKKCGVKVEKQDEGSISRGSCRHGIRCFRRNPTHRSEEAHPGDLDYRRPNYPLPPKGTPECPFSDRCYRRNPVHFREFSHPETDFEHNLKVNRLRRQQQCQIQAQKNITGNTPASNDSDSENDLNELFFETDCEDSEFICPEEESEDSEEFSRDYDDCDRAEE